MTEDIKHRHSHAHHNHSRQHMDESEKYKRKTLKTNRFRKTFVNVLFYVLCLFAVLLVLFVGWIYTNE